jgi:hypothetical protein
MTATSRRYRTSPLREVHPPSHREWLAQQGDKAQLFEDQFVHWQHELSEFDRVAKFRLYENQSFTELDLISHRRCIHSLLAAGEGLTLDLYGLLAENLLDREAAEGRMGLIQEHIQKLMECLLKWHTSIEDQEDVPESLKESFRQVEAGDYEEDPPSDAPLNADI